MTDGTYLCTQIWFDLIMLTYLLNSCQVVYSAMSERSSFSPETGRVRPVMRKSARGVSL